MYMHGDMRLLGGAARLRRYKNHICVLRYVYTRCHHRWHITHVPTYLGIYGPVLSDLTSHGPAIVETLPAVWQGRSL